MLKIDEDARQEAGRLLQLEADGKLQQEALALALQLNRNQEKAMHDLHELDRRMLNEWTRTRE